MTGSSKLTWRAIETEPDSENIKIADNIDKYTIQPNCLENWCLADFVSQIDISYMAYWENKEKDIHDIEATVVNDTTEYTEEPQFPLKLKDGMMLRKHKRRKIIRFVNYELKVDVENFYHEKLS